MAGAPPGKNRLAGRHHLRQSGPRQHFDAAGDPVLSFGPDNTVYYGNIVFSRTPFEGGHLASGSWSTSRTRADPPGHHRCGYHARGGRRRLSGRPTRR
jgi:hypothetical protein